MDTGATRMPADLVAMLGRQVTAHPHAPCLTFGDQHMDFAELGRLSDRIASALEATGVSPGDRVAILAPASPLFFELLFGCAKAGTILVPLNWRLSAREIASVLADAEPSLVFVSEGFAALLPADLPATVIRTENAAAWRDAAPARAIPPQQDPNAPVLILYTSGTTGHAKGAMLSQANLCYLERTAREKQGFTGASRNLVAMPLFHIGGIGYALLGLSQGGETVLVQDTDPGTMIALMARHAITHAFFVPTVIQRLVDYIEQAEIPAPHVDHLVYGAAPMGPALLRRAMDAFGSRFHHAYGLTETASTVVTLGPEDHDPDGPFACHDVVLSPDAAAMRFTEHGVSGRQALPSTWGGITLFRIEGGRLRQGWAEEDYFARKRQLKTGICDTILPPHRAPWDEPVLPSDPASERVLRNLLADPAALLERAEDIGMEGPRLRDLLVPTSIEINTLFTAGARAAFHAVIAGTYRGGFADITPEGQAGSLPVAGIADIAGGKVTRIQLCGDRLGLSRQWLTRTQEAPKLQGGMS